ncbi:Translation machinery-associated protein 22 [Sorochytrium milnesiophthora]
MNAPRSNIIYCGVCSLPCEYCEYSGTLKLCQRWLQQHSEEEYTRLYGDQQQPEDADKKAKEDKASDKVERRKEREQEAKQRAKVAVRSERRKGKKMVTVVVGLDVFDVDPKKASKQFSSRFATGCSVQHNAEGACEIIIQGDVVDDVRDLIASEWPQANLA